MKDVIRVSGQNKIREKIVVPNPLEIPHINIELNNFHGQKRYHYGQQHHGRQRGYGDGDTF